MTRRSVIGLGLAAVGMVFGLRAWQSSSREVTVRYDAPPGELTVIIRDAAGQRVRRSSFGPGVERQHALRLPDGQYRVEMRVGGRIQTRPFMISQDAALLIDWR
jgi:hypothetical protein